MAWVVDTCMILDVLEDDPAFGLLSAECLEQHVSTGLVISPVTYAELAPAFEGNRTLQEEFLGSAGIEFRVAWEWQDTQQAHKSWHAHIRRRRRQEGRKRPLADILIGSFALRFEGLLTRNPSDFRTAFPDLQLRSPSSG